MNVLTYGCIIASLARARRRRPRRECRPWIRSPRAVRRRVAVLRRGRRALREPHRARAVRDRRPRASRVAERAAESSSRRVQGIRQAGVGRGSVRQRNRASSFAAEAPTAKKGIPGTLDAQVTYTAGRSRAADQLPGRRRRADAREPDAAFVFQPARDRRCAEPLPRDQCEHVSAGRRDADSDRRARAGRKLAVRFSGTDRDWLAPSHRSCATDARRRIRSQLQPQSRRTRRWRSRRACSTRRAGGRSSCARPSRDCSSIPARWSAIAASASSRSTILIRRTGRSFPRRCCGRASAIESTTVYAFGW